jgi:hypothetical protein
MTWINKNIITENDYGFVYKITNTKARKIYIGKKALYHTRKKKTLKKDKTRKKFRYVIVDSGWENYWGSSKELLEDYKLNPEFFIKEILTTARDKKQLSYLELKYQIIYEVLEKDTYNKNILGRFFKKDV